MNPLRSIRNAFANLARAVQLLAEIREGVANLTDVVDRRLRVLSSNEQRGDASADFPGEDVRQALVDLRQDIGTANSGLGNLPASGMTLSKRSPSAKRPPSSLTLGQD